jgi:predicted ATP-dependent serine protease
VSTHDAGYCRRVDASLSLKPERLRVVPLAGRRRVRTETLTALLKMPRGAVAVFVGWQGIGKGTILSRVAADETQRGYGVGIVSDEDSLDATILPRLQAAGADLAHVQTFEPIDPDDVGVLVPTDNAEIAQAVEFYGIRLLILDPWTNHIDVSDVDKG